MFIGQIRHDSTPRSTLDKSLFYEERFVHFFDGSDVLADRRRDSADAHRTALEFLDYRSENFVVDLVQSALVDVERIERKF